VGAQNPAIAKDVLDTALHGISFVAVEEDSGDIAGFVLNNVLHRQVTSNPEDASNRASRRQYPIPH
jgi:hypothetical protein